MIEERNAYIRYITDHNLLENGKVASLEQMRATNIKAHGKEIPFSYIPLFINEKDLEFFNGELEKISGILTKMTQHYIEDPQYRKRFGFSPEMEALICLPCNYEEMIPVGRYDIFLDETTGNYSYCEFNTDGTGGMSRDLAISKAILNTISPADPVQIPATEHGNDTLHLYCGKTVDAIVDELLRIYRSSNGAVSDPTFCITDFQEEIVWSDVEAFLASFRKNGISARFTDIRNLKFDGQALYDAADGTVIHGIYRRAVTNVVLERLEACSGLIDAVKAGKVTLLGHFRTSLAHSKVIMCAMHDPKTHRFLTEAEIEYIKMHVPYTIRFTSDGIDAEMMNEVLLHKEAWVIKPENDFGSHGVYCGSDFTEDQWSSVLKENLDKGFVLQQFCKRYPVPVLSPEDSTVRAYPLMLGIYQAAGKVVGFYSRAGENGLIDFDHGGLCVSTVYTERSK